MRQDSRTNSCHISFRQYPIIRYIMSLEIESIRDNKLYTFAFAACWWEGTEGLLANWLNRQEGGARAIQAREVEPFREGRGYNEQVLPKGATQNRWCFNEGVCAVFNYVPGTG
jgi:hypothetical protein